jgi:hypothetical protein
LAFTTIRLIAVFAFRDIFIIQIIGILQDRKYCGCLRLNCDEIPASIFFTEGRVTRIIYETHAPPEALRLLLWRCWGELELDTSVPPQEATLDYPALVEDILQQRLPPMPAVCPMLEYAQVERTSLKSAQQSIFRDSGFNILLAIKKNTRLLDLYPHIEPDLFWPVFLHLCSNGQLLCDYAPILGNLLHSFERDLFAFLQKLLGPQASKTCQDAFHKQMRTHWPAWHTGMTFDIVYGAMPYYDWAKSLKSALAQLGAPTMTAHCYDKALSKLNDSDALLFKQLSSF